MPDLKDVHVNEVLTNLSIAYRPEGFSARELFPVLKVAKESDVYFKYGKEGMKLYSGAVRAPGAPAIEVNYDVSTEGYVCMEYAYSHPIPKRIRANADKPLDPDKDASLFLSDIIITQEEKFAYDAIFAVLDAVGYKATPNPLWDASSATPIKDVEDAKEEIRKRIFKEPNVMLMPQTVFNALKVESSILDAIKYTQKGIITADLLSSLFGLKVVVVYSGYISDDETTHTYIWDKDCFIAYVAPRPGIRSISFGYTFMTRDKRVRKWWDEARESDIIEVSSVYTQKVIANDAAYMLENVIS